MAGPLHSWSALELKAGLESRTISSKEVVRALIARRDEVDSKVRAIVHRFDEEALERAEQIDREREAGRPLGPLAGLPITVKECVATRGLPVTLGVRARMQEVADKDAVLVGLLREAGAILIGKTNVSQLLLFHESDNPIWGQTKNPFALDRTPGGSSGGEAAALAAGLTPLGIGTDIGGSVRVPAAFSGVSSLKPTLDRWSNSGSHTAIKGQEAIRGQIGPMARSARDVAFLFGALDPTAQAARDPAVPPLPPGDAPLLSGLRIGIYDDDGFFRPARSVQRAVKEAGLAAEASGAEVFPFTPPSAREVIDVYLGALSSDGGETIDRLLEGEPLAPQLVELRKIARLPSAARKAAGAVMGLRGEERVARFLDVVSKKSVADFWRLVDRRTTIRRAVFAAWAEARIDAVICPVHVTPALKHGQSGDFAAAGCYSMYYNFLQFPAGVVQVSRVQPGEAERKDPKDRFDRKAAEVEAGSTGLPLGVQVVSKPWNEAVALAIMTAIEDQRRNDPSFPRTPVDPR
jgi:fatty acid amide hydrolase